MKFILATVAFAAAAVATVVACLVVASTLLGLAPDADRTGLSGALAGGLAGVVLAPLVGFRVAMLVWRSPAATDDPAASASERRKLFILSVLAGMACFVVADLLFGFVVFLVARQGDNLGGIAVLLIAACAGLYGQSRTYRWLLEGSTRARSTTAL